MRLLSEKSEKLWGKTDRGRWLRAMRAAGGAGAGPFPARVRGPTVTAGAAAHWQAQLELEPGRGGRA